MKELSLEQMSNVEGGDCTFATQAVLIFWSSGIGYAFGAWSGGLGFAVGAALSLGVLAACYDW